MNEARYFGYTRRERLVWSVPSRPGTLRCYCSPSSSPRSSYGDWDVYVHSNQDGNTVTASDGGHFKSWYTDSSGYADVYLAGASPGSTISVTAGGAHCSTTAG